MKMDRIADMPLGEVVDLHVTIPRDMLAGIDREAKDLGLRRTGLIRRALEEFLKSMEKQRTTREMHEYAEALGDLSGDFVRETGEQTLRRLAEETEW